MNLKDEIEKRRKYQVLSLTNQCYPWCRKLKWSTTVIQSLYREVIMLIYTAVFVCFLYSCNILYKFTLLTVKHVGSNVHVYHGINSQTDDFLNGIYYSDDFTVLWLVLVHYRARNLDKKLFLCLKKTIWFLSLTKTLSFLRGSE